MHLRTLPYDRPAPPAPRSPRSRDNGDLFAFVCWAIVMICIAIGVAR